MTTRMVVQTILPTAEGFRMGEDLLKQHLAWMRGAGRSPRTIEARDSILGSLIRHLDPKPLTDATESDLVSFLGDNNWATGTRRTYHAHMHAFYKWCLLRGHVTTDPMFDLPKARMFRRPPRPIPQAEYEAALILANPRTRIFLLLARNLGLRAVEIANLRPEHIDLTHRRVDITGKGGKPAVMRLPPACADALADWLTATGDTWHMGADAVSAAGNYALKAAGSTSTFHACRHAFATELYDKSRDISLVSRALRHSQLSTTAIYAEARDDQLDAALDEMGA